MVVQFMEYRSEIGAKSIGHGIALWQIAFLVCMKSWVKPPSCTEKKSVPKQLEGSSKVLRAGIDAVTDREMMQLFGYGLCISPKGSHRSLVLRRRCWELGET